MNFAQLQQAWPWAAIRGCPGRWLMRPVATMPTPSEVLGPDVRIRRFDCPAAKDAVLVAWFVDGGLISYARADGVYVHTLNTPEGMRRKLARLGLPVEPDGNG